MKRIMIFIGLKIGEILAIVFVPWGIGLWDPLGFGGDVAWVMGASTIIMISLCLFLLYLFILLNWWLSKKLSK